ncbi:unnamed protein product [Camellia sinensis]
MKVVWIMGLSCSCIIIFVKLMDDYPPCNIFLKKVEEEKSVQFARDMVLEVHIDGNTEKKRKSKNTKIDHRIGRNPLTFSQSLPLKLNKIQYPPLNNIININIHIRTLDSRFLRNLLIGGIEDRGSVAARIGGELRGERVEEVFRVGEEVEIVEGEIEVVEIGVER